VGDRRRGAVAGVRVVGDGQEADAVVEAASVGEGGVEVLDDGDAGGRGRGGDPVPDDGVAVLLGHRDDVALDPVGVGLDGGVVPAGGSGGHPVVEVLGERAEADQGVVRGAAAQDAGPRVADEGVAARLLHGRVVVVEV